MSEQATVETALPVTPEPAPAETPPGREAALEKMRDAFELARLARPTLFPTEEPKKTEEPPAETQAPEPAPEPAPTPAPEAKKEEPPDERFSASFAKLLREKQAQDRANRERQAQLEAEKQAHAERLARLERFEQVRELAQTDPDAALRSLSELYEAENFTYDGITRKRLSGTAKAEISAAERRIEAIEQAFTNLLEEREKDREEAAQKAREEKVFQYAAWVKDDWLPKQNSGVLKKYPLIEAHNKAFAVAHYNLEHLKEHGILLTEEEAAAKVEEQLQKEYELSHSVRSPAPKAPEPHTAPTGERARVTGDGLPSLSNRHSVAPPAPDNGYIRDDEASKARMLRRLREARAASAIKD